MGKPIDNLNFWKERIERAKNSNRHHSVYLIDSERWKRIEQSHRDLMSKLITGKVLDAGCGYGRMSEWVEDYTGVDFSPDFVETARQLYPDKRFIVGNLKKLPFKNEEFDWAVCISIKQMVKDNLGEEEWLLMQKELKRVAKKVLILEYSFHGEHEIL